MKVLLDENMPHELRFRLGDHEVSTTDHQHWKGVRNGQLLKRAEDAGFELLITADQSMPYQQNMQGRRLSLLILSTNHWPRIRLEIAAITEAIHQCEPGSVSSVVI